MYGYADILNQLCDSRRSSGPGGVMMIVHVLIFVAAVVGMIYAITVGDGPYAMLWGIVALCFAFVTAEASDS